MDKISKKDLLLLLGKDRSYVVRPSLFSCKYGTCDLRKFVGKRFGIKIKLGKESFTIAKPNIVDFLRKAKRGPQIIMAKDIGVIVSVTGCSPRWRVVDAGTGSGFLAMFLANLGCNVYTYEKNKEFFKIAKNNVNNLGLKNVKIRNYDVTKGIREREVDLVTLDMQNPERAIKNAYKALKPGGWLAVYSMHIEEVKDVYSEILKHDFADVKILESLQREWQTLGKFTRPRTYMMAHTGFLTFARKL